MTKNYPHNNDLPYSDENVGNIDDFDETIGDVPELSDEQKQQFDNRYGKRSWWQRIKRTIQGKNEVGEYVGLGLDVVESFLPRYVSRIRDIFQSKQKTNTMLQGKKWYKSKTIWSAILIVIMAVLQALGVDVAANPELTATIFEVAMLLAGAFGLVGLRDAIDKQSDRFTKDEQ